MPVSTTIRFEAMEPSPALREDIERHVHKLSQLTTRLTSCDVAVRRSEQRHVHGNRYLVRVSARLDGIPFEAGRILARFIEGARFVPLDSRNHLILGQEPAWPKLVGHIREFLADPEG